MAYLVGQRTLRRYAHRFSPKKFTQPQLFAALVLKEFLQLDYRKLSQFFRDAPEFRTVIELDSVPHFTTFQKAAQRLLISARARRLLDKTIKIAVKHRCVCRRVRLAALDGTGLESHHASSYYVRRRAAGGKTWQKTTYTRFPKAGILCDCRSHLILAVVPGRGPRPDIQHFRVALDQALHVIRIDALAADAGYDSEGAHRYARQERGVRTLIPPLAGRPTKKLPSGYWRRMMATCLKHSRYGQRWQVETVTSMLKRLMGAALRARQYWSQCREILLRSLTLNIMILWRIEVFYRALHAPFPPSAFLANLQIAQLFNPTSRHIVVPTPHTVNSIGPMSGWRPRGNTRKDGPLRAFAPDATQTSSQYPVAMRKSTSACFLSPTLLDLAVTGRKPSTRME